MLSNYPPGFHGGVQYDDGVLHRCPQCGKEWHAVMFYELGGWFYQNDDDAYCPDGCKDAEGYDQEGEISE
jgi:hypothetical protein